MPEYIELERLRDEILYDPNFDSDTINYFLGVVDSQPAADVAEVVRCKDCEKWDTSNRFLNTCACSRWSQSKSAPRLTKPDDFCSYAEKKEGAEG